MRVQDKTRAQGRTNRWIAWLLRSPLHRLLDSTTMLLSVTGRRTGVSYTRPVHYVRDGQTLIVVSRADQTWWRNVGNGSVALHRGGRDFYGHGETITEAPAVAALLHDLITRVPSSRRLFRVRLTTKTHPSDLTRVASRITDRVVIRISDLHAIVMGKGMIDG